MLRRSIFAFAAAVTIVGAWAACVGDDPTLPASGERGAQNQLCFENNTCLAGLACVAGRCQVDADGAASSSSSSASSASSSSSSSASSSSSSSSTGGTSGSGSSTSGGDPDKCGNLTVPGHLVCPLDPKDEDCTPSQKCCLGTGCAPSCPTGDNPFECFSSHECSAPKPICCMPGSVAALSPEVCGADRVIEPLTTTSRAICSASCAAAGSVQFCGGGQACPPPKQCKDVLLRFVDVNPPERLVKVCD